MDLSKLGEGALLALGVVLAVLLGIRVALALLAPKTESDLDDRALGVVDKVVRALEWVRDKLLVLVKPKP